MDEAEYQKRCERWNNEDLTADRALGRLEGQLMMFERYLYWLTTLGIDAGKAIQMLREDVATHDALIAMEPRLRDFRERQRGKSHQNGVLTVTDVV